VDSKPHMFLKPKLRPATTVVAAAMMCAKGISELKLRVQTLRSSDAKSELDTLAISAEDGGSQFRPSRLSVLPTDAVQ
jgi:hypothetical protein